MKSYYVKFKDSMGEHGVWVLAKNKEDAYDKATYEFIPKLTGHVPYSSWVWSVTYQNGKVHYFNTSEGNAY